MSTQLANEAPLSPDLSSLERFTAAFRLLTVGLWDAFGTAAPHMDGVLLAATYILPFTQYMLLLANTWHTFHLYRTRSLAMRRGDYFFPRQKYTQDYCNRYIGFQVPERTDVPPPVKKMCNSRLS